MLTLFNVTGIIPSVGGLSLHDSSLLDQMNQTAGLPTTEVQNKNSFWQSVINLGNFEKNPDALKYNPTSLADQSAVYLQSGMDFPTGLYYFYKYIIMGSTLLYPVLMTIGVPNQLIWVIMIPLSLMFILAIIQFISGRSFEANK
jgi:hypothetical protein